MKRLFAAALAAVLTLTLQRLVGDPLLYYGIQRSDASAIQLHEAILHNRVPPNTTWEQMGANATNLRVGVVYLAEAIRRLTNRPVLSVYRAIDTVALWLTFLALAAYLRRWIDDALVLVGMLYAAVVFILTYHYFYFHPWDRIGLLAWIGLLALVRARAFAALLVAIPVAVLIKYDVAAVPLLYGALWVTRDRWRRTTLETAALLAAAVAMFACLRWLLPGGIVSAPGTDSGNDLLRFNLREALAMKLTWPPLLAFGLPVMLGLTCWATLGRELRVMLIFALLIFGVFLVGSYVREVRAQMPILVLLLPPALVAARQLLEPAHPQHSRAVEAFHR